MGLLKRLLGLDACHGLNHGGDKDVISPQDSPRPAELTPVTLISGKTAEHATGMDEADADDDSYAVTAYVPTTENTSEAPVADENALNECVVCTLVTAARLAQSSRPTIERMYSRICILSPQMHEPQLQATQQAVDDAINKWTASNTSASPSALFIAVKRVGTKAGELLGGDDAVEIAALLRQQLQQPLTAIPQCAVREAFLATAATFGLIPTASLSRQNTAGQRSFTWRSRNKIRNVVDVFLSASYQKVDDGTLVPSIVMRPKLATSNAGLTSPSSAIVPLPQHFPTDVSAIGNIPITNSLAAPATSGTLLRCQKVLDEHRMCVTLINADGVVLYQNDESKCYWGHLTDLHRGQLSVQTSFVQLQSGENVLQAMLRMLFSMEVEPAFLESLQACMKSHDTWRRVMEVPRPLKTEASADGWAFRNAGDIAAPGGQLEQVVEDFEESSSSRNSKDGEVQPQQPLPQQRSISPGPERELSVLRLPNRNVSFSEKLVCQLNGDSDDGSGMPACPLPAPRSARRALAVDKQQDALPQPATALRPQAPAGTAIKRSTDTVQQQSSSTTVARVRETASTNPQEPAGTVQASPRRLLMRPAQISSNALGTPDSPKSRGSRAFSQSGIAGLSFEPSSTLLHLMSRGNSIGGNKQGSSDTYSSDPRSSGAQSLMPRPPNARSVSTRERNGDNTSSSGGAPQHSSAPTAPSPPPAQLANSQPIRSMSSSGPYNSMGLMKSVVPARAASIASQTLPENEVAEINDSLPTAAALVPAVEPMQATAVVVKEVHAKYMHDVYVQPLEDPATGRDMFMILQEDISSRAAVEKAHASIAETLATLLQTTLPMHILEQYERLGDCTHLARRHEGVTILFTDIIGFTSMSKEVKPMQVMSYLNELFTEFDRLVDICGCYKVETAGDCYIAAGGLMRNDEESDCLELDEHPDAVAGAQSIFQFAKALLHAASFVNMPNSGKPTQVRVGIHTGDCVSGLIGTKLPKFSLFGDTMNTSSRMESTAPPGCIQVSEATFEMLTTGNKAVPRDEFKPTNGIEVKGKGKLNTFVWDPKQHAEEMERCFGSLPKTGSSKSLNASSGRPSQHHTSSSSRLTRGADPPISQSSGTIEPPSRTSHRSLLCEAMTAIATAYAAEEEHSRNGTALTQAALMQHYRSASGAGHANNSRRGSRNPSDFGGSATSGHRINIPGALPSSDGGASCRESQASRKSARSYASGASGPHAARTSRSAVLNMVRETVRRAYSARSIGYTPNTSIPDPNADRGIPIRDQEVVSPVPAGHTTSGIPSGSSLCEAAHLQNKRSVTFLREADSEDEMRVVNPFSTGTHRSPGRETDRLQAVCAAAYNLRAIQQQDPTQLKSRASMSTVDTSPSRNLSPTAGRGTTNSLPDPATRRSLGSRPAHSKE